MSCVNVKGFRNRRVWQTEFSRRDYARLDLRLSEENHLYVLEVNPNPDVTESVSFTESAEKMGQAFSGTLRTIVEFALHRKQPA